MARYVQGKPQGFVVACLLGALAPLAMANGILALPVMALYLMLMRQSFSRVLVVLSLWLLLLGLYLAGYTRPDSHGQPAEAISRHTVDLCRYVLLYLGSPFNHMAKGGWLGWTLAMWSGLLLLLASVATAIWQFRRTERSPYAVALLCFIGYILCTALITGAGRLVFGLPQALSPRYTTPALMAWAALLVALQVGKSGPLPAGIRRTIKIGLSACALAMLIYQLQAIRPEDENLAAKRLAALALAIGARDEAAIATVTPDVGSTLEIVRNAGAQHYGIFGSPPFADAKAILGTTLSLPETAAVCTAALSSPVPIEGGEKEFVRVSGWLRNGSNLASRQIRFLDAQGKVVGLALSSESRRSLQNDTDGRQANFHGYLLASVVGMPSWLALDDVPLCRLPRT